MVVAWLSPDFPWLATIALFVSPSSLIEKDGTERDKSISRVNWFASTTWESDVEATEAGRATYA